MSESLWLGVDPATPRERADLLDLVAAARRLVDDAGSEALRREWRRLQARLNEPHFSVAVVGEFSRGKSTLINRLLDAEILPVGAIPTTALLTRLRYAPEPSVQGVRRDGSRERLDAAPESWQRMLEGAEEPPWVTLQYGAPNEWLRVSGIQLFDTPGAGDLESSRMEEVIDAISVSDATLVAIDARMPLSLTEKAFIEQHLLERRVPHVVAVLTHLDEIQPANRAAVTRHVQDRLGALHPEIVFACAHDGAVLPAEVEVGSAGAEAIRALLSQWAAEPEHRELVRRQLLANLERLLALVESELGARRAAAAMDTEERRRELEEERFRFDHSRLDWEDLRLALRERCDAAVEWTRDQLGKAEEAIGEKLDHELRCAPDPGIWWRQELPYRLRQELAAVAASTGEPLQRRVLADFSWLAQEVDGRFGRRLGSQPADPFVEEIPTIGEIGPAQDLRAVQVTARLGAGAATILGYWLYGPMGMAASVGAGLIGEYLIRKQADGQRASLARDLRPILQRSLAHAAGTVQRRLQAQYDAFLADTRREEELWSAIRKEALEDAPRALPAGEERLAASFGLIESLRSQIHGDAEEG